MMTVEAIYEIRGRGIVACVKLDVDYSDVRTAWVGAWLCRADGARWQIAGIEAFTKLAKPREGEPVGLLLKGSSDVKVGDEVDVKDV